MTETKPENEQPNQDDEKNYAFGKKFKYTLDSDEEDDEVDAEKYNVMTDEALEGIEKSTIDFDGDIKITPFNMDEELETGHFDKEGTYIFKKENVIRDNWLDNIDWNGVKPDPFFNKKSKETDDQDNASDDDNEDDDDDDEDSLSETKIKQYYSEIIELIQPGETIRKAIQRYGKQSCNNKRDNRKGQKRKINPKDNEPCNNGKSEETNQSIKDKMLRLITIADRILQTGDMDIYERTYEQLRLHLNKSKELPLATDGEDMFGDDFDVEATTKSSSVLDDSKTQWEYKWKEDDEQVYGPYSSEDMLAWVNQGYFDNGILVRRKDATDSKFYSSKRIDFELYI